MVRDKILLKDLRVQAILGVREWERHTPQEILVNLCAFTDTRPAGTSDKFSDCVDYSSLAKTVRSLVETAHRQTVEALAEDIAALCLQDPRISKVIVRVEKPGAVTSAASAGVEIERP